MKFLMMALLACLCTLPAAAEETGWQVDVHLLKVGPRAQARLRTYEESEWKQFVSGPDVQVLDSGTLLGKDEQEAQLIVGGKVPLAYNDPRAAGYQVMYIDTGYKVDVMPSVVAGGRFRINCHIARKQLTEVEGLPLPQQDGVSLTSVVVLKPRQVVVAALTRGVLTGGYMQSSYPNAALTERDTFIVAISIRRT